MYNYETEKKILFTDKGQRLFLKIRDYVKNRIKEAGAVRLDKIISQFSGNTWEMMACVDRMVELEEITEVNKDVVFDYRIYTYYDFH